MAAKRTTLFLFILILLIAGVAFWQLQAGKTLQGGLQHVTDLFEKVEEQGQQADREVADSVIDEVRTLMDLPEDESPTVASIIDVELLREQNPFYDNAENGDYLIVTSEKAILYSAARKKIIDVIPVKLTPVEAEKEEPEEQGES